MRRKTRSRDYTRKSSRGRVKTGGYLDIWSDPETNDRNQTHGDLPDPNEEVNKM